MDALKAQLLRIQQQLNGLNASQKMLTASLVAIMVMTVFWWTRFAGTAEMTPVLDQPLSMVDLGQIKSILDSKEIDCRIVGDRILVPADRKFEAVAILAYNNRLPTNVYAAWDDMVSKQTPWDSSSKTASLQNHAKERLLSDMMTFNFPGVQHANVLINTVGERRVTGSLEPSASVLITTTHGPEVNVNKLVAAAAQTVASAVSGLTAAKVSVVVDGTPHRVPDPNSSVGGGDLYENIAAQEKAKEDKLREMLPPGSLIAVTVDIDSTKKIQNHVAYNPAETVVKPRMEENQTHENSQVAPPTAEPGVNSNTALSIAAAPTQAGQTNNSEQTHTENVIGMGKLDETMETPGGKPTVVSATVRIPRSYFTKMLRGDSASSKEPDEAAVEAKMGPELAKVRSDVKNAIGMKSDDNLSIDTYFDTDATTLAAVAEPSPASSMTAAVGGHAKELALGVLAIISLFMVSMIVKKGSPAPAIAVEPAPRETPHLNGGEDVAGIAADNHATLDAMEMDEGTVKAQQMVEQVSTMVKENPDAAANLVKRWLNRS